jgi:NACalpha-BTF3-like transcription factor
LNKDLDDLDKNILQSSEWSAPITEAAKQGNVEGVYVYNKRVINPKKQATAYASLFDLDRKFQAGLREMFPDLAGLPKEQLKAQGIPLLVQQRVREESSKPDFQPNKDLTMQNLAIRRENRLAAGEGGINEVGEVEVNKEFFGESTKTASGQRVKTPVKTIGFDYFIKPTQKNFASTQLNNVLNLSTGENQMMSADTNAALIGLGYTKTKGGKLQVKAVVVNSDKDEFVVNELDLPIKVRNSDEYKAAKNKLNSEYKRLQQSKPTTKPKTYSQSDENGIKAVMSKNNITRQEAINALISAGKLSK